jgi:triphosphoribosyl-dephospho-CoA synthase
LVAGLQAELDLTPKPGLVDRRDNGAHADLDYALMQRSIVLLGYYFNQCTAALQTGCGIETLRELGMQAERRMFYQLGTNTHRGAIFLGGLLLGALQRADNTDSATVSDAVAGCAHELFATRLPRATKGAKIRARYQAGGIIREALVGLPSVFASGVPALTEAGQLGLCGDGILFFAMARLMQTVEDTTALRRCGPAGLAQLQQDGAALEKILRAGDDAETFLTRTNQRYRQQNLTMGGVADLLAVSIAFASIRGDRYERAASRQHS